LAVTAGKFEEEYEVRAYTFAFLAFLLLIAGCEPDKHMVNLEEKNFQLEKQNRQLEKDIKTIRAENKQLSNQLETLSDLSSDDRLDSLYELESVKLARFTNFYDRDKDGMKEKLIAYVQPVDSEGDVIKASGLVNIELWNLNRGTDENALMGKWQYSPEQLKQMWFTGIIGANYRFVIETAEIVPSFDEPLTVKMTFTDYVTGKVFTEQKLLKP
jgi:hypothetical protein